MKRSLPLLGASVLLLTLAACSGTAPQPSGDAACPPVQVSGPDGQPLDLSGSWSGNDGGLYYMKQIGNCLWWSGLSNFVDQGQYPGQEWVMAFRGTIDANGVINGDFVDVKSSNPGNGTMTIEPRIDSVDGVNVINMYRTGSTGHEIGVTFWRRTPEATPTDPPPPTDVPAPSDGPTDAVPPTQVPADTTVPTTAPS